NYFRSIPMSTGFGLISEGPRGARRVPATWIFERRIPMTHSQSARNCAAKAGGMRRAMRMARLWLGVWASLGVVRLGAVSALEVNVDVEQERGVEALVGETLTLRLRSAPSTGYTWQLQDAAPQYVRIVGDPTYEAPSTTALGAAGYQVFKLHLDKPGNA